MHRSLDWNLVNSDQAVELDSRDSAPLSVARSLSTPEVTLLHIYAATYDRRVNLSRRALQRYDGRGLHLCG